MLDCFSLDGHKLAPVALHVRGTSLFVAEKPPLVGGPDKLPQVRSKRAMALR